MIYLKYLIYNTSLCLHNTENISSRLAAASALVGREVAGLTGSPRAVVVGTRRRGASPGAPPRTLPTWRAALEHGSGHVQIRRTHTN